MVTQLVSAVLSSIAIFPTIWVLIKCLDDRRIRKQMGINGELAALAAHSVRRERLRVLKHLILIGGIWLSYCGIKLFWLNPLIGGLLSATGVYELIFRHRLEQYIRMRQKSLGGQKWRIQN